MADEYDPTKDEELRADMETIPDKVTLLCLADEMADWAGEVICAAAEDNDGVFLDMMERLTGALDNFRNYVIANAVLPSEG